MVLQATPQEVMRVVHRLRDFCQTHQISKEVTHALALALEETATNIISHAYKREPRHRFHVHAQHKADRVELELRDHGPAINPFELPASEPDEEEGGGWGIQLVRHYMDEIHYRRDGEENVLQMVKLLRLAG